MNRQVIKNRIRKVLAYTVTAVLFLIISAFLVLQIPPVQNYLISHYLKDFTKATGFPSTIGSFSMLWFDRLELVDVKIYDPEGHKMISADRILVNFKISNLMEERNINIDGVFVDSAHVYLTKINSGDTVRDLNINIFINRINQNFASGSGGGKSPRINIGEAFLNQSQFTYINQDQDSIKGFDYNHFSLAVDEGQLKSFVVLGDTIEFDVRTLIAEDLKTKFGIKQLSTFFRISQQSMEFLGMDLKAGESVISDTVIFRYGHQRDLEHFVSKVRIHANLKNTLIDPRDLALFAPGVERINQLIQVSGAVNGRVDKFKFTKMDLQFGNTRLMGSLDMDGLPEINETFINLNVRNSKLDPDDLSFILDERVLKRLRPMGLVGMNGQFLGYPSDFVANGSFSGKLGAIRSDINFKVNEKDFDRSTYSGKLSLVNFDVGRYLNDTTYFQKVNLDGKVSGSGLTQRTADFQLTGNVSSIGIYGYNYSNIVTDARFASGLFRGMVEVNDPNLQLRTRGSIDLREGRNQIRIRAQLDTANLQPLHLSREPAFIQVGLIADISGLSLDSLKGTASFTGLQVGYRNQWLKLDRIFVDAQRDVNTRSFKVESSVADVEVKGNFHYSDISRDVQMLTKEVALNIRNNKAEIENYYDQKKYKPKSYSANVAITLKDIEPLTDLLNVNLELSKNTSIEGRFTSGNTTILNVYTQFDSLRYNGMTFLKNETDITVSKISDSTSVLAMATVSSGSQEINKNLKLKNLLTEAIWNKQHIDFSIDTDQEGSTNAARLKGALDFMRDSTVITMSPSALKLLERDWMFAPGNFISVQGKDWRFHQLALTNAEQSVSLDGLVSPDPTKVVSLQLEKLDLSLLDVLSKNKFKGIANARIDVTSFYKDPMVFNDILISELTVNDFLVGNIQGVNKWDTLNRKFDIDLFIDRNDKRIVDLDGTYNPTNTKNALDIVAKLDKAEIKLLEPFLKDIFSQMGGTVSGNFTIKGPLNAPLIDGEGVVNQGQLMVNYLKTMYRITGIVGLTPTSIYFKDIELTDVFRNKGRLEGTISHNNFFSMFVDLKANFKSLQVLNTTVKDNNLFYGQAYATGDLTFYGPISNLKITSNARTEKKTSVYIPIGGSSSIEKKDFITFVDFRDSTATKTIQTDLKKKIDLTGLTFDLNLDVTPDAYCEIIFDQKAGDIIRGRGNGDIKLQLDTKGEFNMFGPFEFTEGWYNFTLYDIINKEFEIKKGSRISWYGDPYLGIININASYNQQASLAPLVTDDAATLPQVKRKYPVQVLLTMEGQMLSPQMKFDIIAEDLPQNIPNPNGTAVNLDLAFTVFKNKLDDQELYRQVFSLIVLKRFSPPDAFDASGSVGNSVSELLSNQLGYWMSQVDENLEFDVDLGSFDENSFNTFQLRVGYRWKRLRVTADGTFNSQGNNPADVSQRTPSSVAGDWTVDYMLTPDGKLRVKMYSRTSQNTVLGSVNNQSVLTTGASLIHTQSFNELRDLWRSSRDKRVKEEEKKKQEEKEEDKKESQKDNEQVVAPNKDAIKEDEDGGRE
jgi:hypothetical protein